MRLGMSVIKRELRFQALSFPSKPLGLHQHPNMGQKPQTFHGDCSSQSQNHWGDGLVGRVFALHMCGFESESLALRWKAKQRWNSIVEGWKPSDHKISYARQTEMASLCPVLRQYVKKWEKVSGILLWPSYVCAQVTTAGYLEAWTMYTYTTYTHTQPTNKQTSKKPKLTTNQSLLSNRETLNSPVKAPVTWQGPWLTLWE